MPENYKRHRAVQRVDDRDVEAYREGADAKLAGRRIGDNPYTKGTTEHRDALPPGVHDQVPRRTGIRRQVLLRRRSLATPT